jgi:transposase
MVDQQIEELNHEIEQIASSDEACQRLRKIPDIGPLIATAIVTTIVNGAAFRRVASSQPLLVLFQDSTQPEARRDCSASASAAARICASC